MSIRSEAGAPGRVVAFAPIAIAAIPGISCPHGQLKRPERIAWDEVEFGSEPPILVEKGAEAEIGDAGAADFAHAREGGGIRRLAKDDVDPIADPLERRAVVRRAQKDDLAELFSPGISRPLRSGEGAARTVSSLCATMARRRCRPAFRCAST